MNKQIPQSTLMCVFVRVYICGGVELAQWNCTHGFMSCVCLHISARHTHLLVHGWQVPDITDDCPAGHHPQQVADHAMLRTVPESISKLWVILRNIQKYIKVY